MTDTPEFFDEETLLEMVENQLADGHPLQVKATLMRLVMKGTPREEALQYIAWAPNSWPWRPNRAPSTSSVTASSSTACPRCPGPNDPGRLGKPRRQPLSLLPPPMTGV